MEPVSAMTELLTNIGTVLTSATSWFGSVSTALIGNEVFQIILAIVIMILLFTLLVNLISKIKVRSRQS